MPEIMNITAKTVTTAFLKILMTDNPEWMNGDNDSDEIIGKIRDKIKSHDLPNRDNLANIFYFPDCRL